MTEFRKLKKEDLYEIISVAKQSHGSTELENYVLPDILSAFDKNQIYKIELYGLFCNGKLVNFSGLAKQPGIGGSYELRLSTTLPEFRNMGYGNKAIDNRIAVISARERNYKCMIQVTSKRPEMYEKFGFIKTGYTSRLGFVHLIKEIH